jgi:hypothetical protein
MSDFQLHRLGMLMEPEPGNPHEVEGVLNPAAAISRPPTMGIQQSMGECFLLTCFCRISSR